MSVLFYEGVDHMIEKITTLIKGKANNSHKHTKSDITDFPSLGTASAKDVASSGNASTSQVVMGNDTRLSDARNASDVSAWAKSSTKPSYTKSEVGLGNVDNTSDTSKPVSTAQQTAIDTAYANANKYTDKKVADLIGSAPETMDTLEEVAAAIQKNKDVEKALNEAIGKKANQTELDTHTGNSTIHITASERKDWNAAKTHADSAHARTDATKVEKSTTNGNIKINGTETTVYIHPSGTNPHGTTKSDVGLGNVGNFKAVSTVASQGLTDTEKSNARKNIGAQVAGSYAASNHTHSQYLTSHQDISGKVNKSGDTLIGKLTRDGGGNWIADRDEVAVFGTKNGGDTYNPVVGQKTALGAWTIGTLAKYENLVFNYSTDENFNSKKNETKQVNLPNKAGTIALTSDIPTIPSSLPANGGNSSTVNGHTVNSDVPSGAKFTDTNTWRPQPDWNATSGDAVIKNKPSIISAEPIEIESETSLNDVVDTGTYYCNYNKTYTNMPPSISNGWLCVSKVSDRIVKQVFLRHGTANTNDYQIYVRTKIGTTWSDWTKVVTSKDYATTSDYGAIKLSTSVSNTSTALAATPSAVKIAYDKAVSAFSGKGLPYAIFDIASDATTSAAWTETALQLKLQKSGAGDRVGSFRHGGSNFIYCPFSGIVDIDVNVFATTATNGYYYARCYKYNTSGDDELLDFAGLGGYTAAGCQGSGSMKVHVTAGTYIYINVAASTVIQASASNSHIRLQYTMID